LDELGIPKLYTHADGKIFKRKPTPYLNSEKDLIVYYRCAKSKCTQANL